MSKDFEPVEDVPEEVLMEAWEFIDEEPWEPSCEMDCELCGCHGDCADCDGYEEDEDG